MVIFMNEELGSETVYFSETSELQITQDQAFLAFESESLV